MQQLKALYQAGKEKAGTKVALVTCAVLASPFASAAGTIDDMTTAATTEMGPVKGAMISVGVILVGIAALGFAIYKVVGMSGGKR